MSHVTDNENIAKTFIEYFSLNGYVIIDSVDITSHIDKTVYLVNSATNLFKPYLSIGDTCIFAIQRCMRTQSLNDYYRIETESKYPTCFVSFGAYVSLDKIDKLVNDTINYLFSLGFVTSKIRVRASGVDKILLDSLSRSALKENIVIDERIEKFSHKYGSDLTGRAVKIDYFQDNMQKHKNICYIVVIYENGVPKGVEFATSDSLILMRLNNLEYALSVAKIADILPVKTFMQRRLADSIVGASNLIYEGVRVNSSNMGGRLLKKYLKAILFFRNELQISYQEILDTIIKYLHFDYGDDIKINKEELDLVLIRYCG